MAIQQSEMLQGAALVRLIRASKPDKLVLIESGQGSSTSIIKLNDAVPLLMKVSKSPQYYNTDEGSQKGRTWQFTFTPSELKQLKGENHATVLVCGVDNLYDLDDAELCFLDIGEIDELLDLAHESTSRAKAVSVRMESNWRQLRVSYGRGKRPLRIWKEALKNWRLPGT